MFDFPDLIRTTRPSSYFSKRQETSGFTGFRGPEAWIFFPAVMGRLT